MLSLSRLDYYESVIYPDPSRLSRILPNSMIQPGFLDSESRQDLTELARDGSVANRLARRANALVLLDDGMSYAAIAKVLLLDEDTIRTWHSPYLEEGIEGLASFSSSRSNRVTSAYSAILSARRRRASPPCGRGWAWCSSPSTSIRT